MLVFIAIVAVSAFILPTSLFTNISTTNKSNEITIYKSESTNTENKEVQAYLLMIVNKETKEPIPLTGEDTITISQNNGEFINVVKVTADSIVMESANCSNQDCIHQGMVSLNNANTRPLNKYIVCLPNQVTLALLTPEELNSEIILF